MQNPDACHTNVLHLLVELRLADSAKVASCELKTAASLDTEMKQFSG